MLYDGIRLQKVILSVIVTVAIIVGVYFSGYSNGKKDQLLQQQSEALLIQEQVNQAAIAVQQEMEKTNAAVERASSVSDDCNFVLNFDLTPCGVLD